jgi:hypothetical protein
MATYNPEMTLAEARALFFARSNFGVDGGYDARWVKIKAWRIPLWFPNTKGRRRAVPFHDLHHILNEFDTDMAGEFEIAAWEVASGIGRHYVGWLLDLLGFAVGLVCYPRRIWRAFIKGRRSLNLYPLEWDERILTRTVGEVRRELRLDRPPVRATFEDAASFLGWSLVAVVTYLLTVGLLVAPFALAGWWLLR